MPRNHDKLLDNDQLVQESIKAVEQNGIVFLDEIDKIAGREGRTVAGHAALARADLVDLVEEHDAVLLDHADRFLHQRIVVEQLVGFLGDQQVVRFLDRDAPRLGAAAAELAEDIADR